MKKPRQRERSGPDAKPYEATIDGKKCRVNCFDAQGNLVLADGQRYTCERLRFIPSGQPPVEPEGDVFGWPLLEIVSLSQWQGDWRWKGEKQLLFEWLKAGTNERPDWTTRAVVSRRLDALPASPQQAVRAVAWFKHDDGAEGWNTPIFLRSFRRIADYARQPKLVTADTPKPVARFENDFAVAVIPQRNQKEQSLTIEPELRELLRQINGAGGRVPRTVLKKDKPDWRPEKLLDSANAKKLIKASLLGQDKSGRTTTYWMKQHAD